MDRSSLPARGVAEPHHHSLRPVGVHPRTCGGNTRQLANYLPVAVRPGWVPRRGGANRLLSRGFPAPAGRSPRAPGSPRIPDCLPRRVGSIPAPGGAPRRDRSRIDLGRRDLSRRARGAPALRVSGSGAGRRYAQGSPSARMILRAISPASLWPARDRHGNSGPLSGSIARLDAPHGVVVPRQLTASDRCHALAQGLQVRSHDASQLDHDVAHKPGGPEDGDHDHTQTPTVNFTSLLTSANLLQHRRKFSSARPAASEPPHRA